MWICEPENSIVNQVKDHMVSAQDNHNNDFSDESAEGNGTDGHDESESEDSDYPH